MSNYLASVRQLQTSADGRYGAAIDALESATRDVLLTLHSVQDDAQYATWAPLVEDSDQRMADATVTVENRIGRTCPSDD